MSKETLSVPHSFEGNAKVAEAFYRYCISKYGENGVDQNAELFDEDAEEAYDQMVDEPFVNRNFWEAESYGKFVLEIKNLIAHFPVDLLEYYGKHHSLKWLDYGSNLYRSSSVINYIDDMAKSLGEQDAELFLRQVENIIVKIIIPETQKLKTKVQEATSKQLPQ